MTFCPQAVNAIINNTAATTRMLFMAITKRATESGRPYLTRGLAFARLHELL
jgi:hypothetical protein